MKEVVHILKKKYQLSILYIYLIETSVSEQESNSDVKDNGIVAYCIFFKIYSVICTLKIGYMKQDKYHNIFCNANVFRYDC